MATGIHDVQCGLCRSRNVSERAEFWCFECEEGICNECHVNFHAIAKAMRNHRAIDIEEYKKIPDWVLNIHLKCQEHGFDYTNFCGSHNCPCCLACMLNSHKECSDVSLLQQTIKSSKDSEMMNATQHNLTDLKSIITNMIEDRQDNLKVVCDQRSHFETKIKEFRQEINNHLTCLEEECLNNLNAAEESIRKSIKLLTDVLEKELRRVEEMTEDSVLIKKHASDLQSFLGIRKIAEDAAKIESSTRNLQQDGSLQRSTLKFEVDDKITNFKTIITTFGTIETEKKPPSFNQSFEEDKHAQITWTAPQSTAGINDIELSLKTTFTCPEEAIEIRGCALLSNGRVIYVSKTNGLVILNGAIVDKKISTSHPPNDVAVVSEKIVAVSVDMGVELIDINSGKIKKKYECGKCGGLTFNGGKLLCCVNGKGVVSIELSTNAISTVIQDASTSPYDYCAADKNHIYRTSFNSKSVCCYSKKGEKLWELKDDKAMAFPYGICVDNSSCLYVVAFKNNSVIAVQPDGKSWRTVLTKDNKLVNPLAINYHSKKHQLLVANLNGPLYLFNFL